LELGHFGSYSNADLLLWLLLLSLQLKSALATPSSLQLDSNHSLPKVTNKIYKAGLLL
jgi:hypothetical protein